MHWEFPIASCAISALVNHRFSWDSFRPIYCSSSPRKKKNLKREGGSHILRLLAQTLSTSASLSPPFLLVRSVSPPANRQFSILTPPLFLLVRQTVTTIDPPSLDNCGTIRTSLDRIPTIRQRGTNTPIPHFRPAGLPSFHFYYFCHIKQIGLCLERKKEN